MNLWRALPARLLASSLAVTSMGLAAELVAPHAARACTAFWVEGTRETGPLVAKSFDWPSPVGYVVLSEAGLRHQKLALPGANAPARTWVATHASLSFTTVGPGFPASGLNDAGLTIEALVDMQTTSNLALDPNRLSVLEWVQRGLDLFADAEAWADEVAGEGLSQVGPPLHLFGCDPKTCVVVESDGRGRVTVQRGLAPTTRVLANNHYEQDRADAKHPPGCLIGLCWNAKGGSARRFGKVAEALETKKRPWTPDEALAELDEVGSASTTAWQLVWELGRHAVTFRVPAGGKRTERLVLPVPTGGGCARDPQVRAIGPRGLAPAGAWQSWGPDEVAAVHYAVLRQLGRQTATTRALAQAVAESTRNVVCASSPPAPPEGKPAASESRPPAH